MRLAHSAEAYRRLMQMSTARLFVFIEGWTERSFYDQLCESVCRPSGVPFEVRTADEVAGGSGGKENLLALFETLRDLGALLEVFQGKKTGVLFFLDKDIDDFTGRIVASAHVVYTEHYHVENYWFRHGDLVTAIVSATALDGATVTGAIGNPEDWRRLAAEQWKDWVKLCVHAHAHSVDCGCRYSAQSQVNDGCYGGLDGGRVAGRLAELRQRAGLPDADFDARHAVVEEWVDRLYAEGRHDAVFRGKWYVYFLVSTIKTAAGPNRKWKTAGLEGRLVAAILATLDFEQAWTEHLKAPIRALVAQL